MTKLIEALTALCGAATAYLERETHPMLPGVLNPHLPAGEVAGPAPKKPRAPKAAALPATAGMSDMDAPKETLKGNEAAAPVPAPAPVQAPDPLADLMGTSAPAPAPAAPALTPALTPEQSMLEMKKSAFGVVKAFPAVTPTGTEGEDKLRALLAAAPFKVAKLMDLTHELRLQFIAAANAIVAGAK